MMKRHGCILRWLGAGLLLGVLAAACLAADDGAAAAGSDARRIIRLINQNEELSAELGKLRGQLDELLNSIDKTRKQQREMYQTLNARIDRMERDRKASASEDDLVRSLKARVQQLEDTVTALRAAMAGANGDNSDMDPAYRSYSAGLEAIRNGEYQVAVAAFRKFLEERPNDAEYAPEAQYWLGEALFRQKQYAPAIEAQRSLLAAHPDSARKPDALLVIGNAELGLGNVDLARHAWQTLIQDHPDSEAAGKARKRLERIN
jgi:tol-pal system protein YbgF